MCLQLAQSLTSHCNQSLGDMNWKFLSIFVLNTFKVKNMELSFKISSLYLLNSATRWRILFELSLVILGLLRVLLQTRTRVHNSSSHINISITSVATGVYAVAHVNICTIVCLPLIRIRMRNDYAWTPVFDKNKSNRTKHNKIQ